MFPSDPPPPRSQRSGLHLPSVFPRSLAYHPRPVGLESSLKPRKPFEVAIWPCTLLDPFVIGTLDPCPSHKEDTWLLACAWEGTFAFVGFRRSSGPKGVPDPESPRGTRSCLSTWNLGVAFPGHPSHPPPATSPPKHKRACRAPIAYGSSGILPESPAQRQTAPLRAARLTFAQLVRRGSPLRPPPRTLRVSRS